MLCALCKIGTCKKSNFCLILHWCANLDQNWKLQSGFLKALKRHDIYCIHVGIGFVDCTGRYFNLLYLLSEEAEVLLIQEVKGKF